jgi:hypothetical protein
LNSSHKIAKVVVSNSGKKATEKRFAMAMRNGEDCDKLGEAVNVSKISVKAAKFELEQRIDNDVAI